MRKLCVSLFLAAICFSAIAAGSKDTGSEAAIPASSGGKLFAAPVVLEMVIASHPTWPYNPDWWIWKALQEKTNVKLEIQAFEQMDDKVILMFASGDTPDIYDSGPTFINKYGPEGAFEDIYAHLNASEMPNFYKFTRTKENAFYVSLYNASDGKLYGVPNYGVGLENTNAWLYREDIFVKHNLAVPTTYDELYEVSRKLKSIYPDSYPFAVRQLFNDWYIAKLNAFGRQWSTGFPIYFDFKTETYRAGVMDEGFRELIAFLARMYKEGLVPQDFASMGSNGWVELMSTDRAFITYDYMTRADFFNNPGRQNNPAFTMRFMPPPAGRVNGVRAVENTAANWASAAVGADSAKVAEAIKYLDWLYSDEAVELCTWGREGETYNVVNGKRVFITDQNGANHKFMFGLSTSGAFLKLDSASFFGQTASKEVAEGLTQTPKYALPLQPIVENSFTEEEMTRNDLVFKGTIYPYFAQEITKFIMNTRPMSDWANFQKEVEAMGLNDILKINNGAYQRSKQ